MKFEQKKCYSSVQPSALEGLMVHSSVITTLSHWSFLQREHCPTGHSYSVNTVPLVIPTARTLSHWSILRREHCPTGHSHSVNTTLSNWSILRREHCSAGHSYRKNTTLSHWPFLQREHHFVPLAIPTA